MRFESRRRANARNVSFRIALRWPIYFINPVDKTKLSYISTKHLYNLLLKKFFVPPTAKAKILRHGFTPETVQKVYELPFQIKHDFNITMFQYKIIHNILATKMSLFRAKISDNNVCPQCLAEAHSINHMFLRCSSVIVFWKTFQIGGQLKRKSN